MDNVQIKFNEILKEYGELYQKGLISSELYHQLYHEIDIARNTYAMKVLKDY